MFGYGLQTDGRPPAASRPTDLGSRAGSIAENAPGQGPVPATGSATGTAAGGRGAKGWFSTGIVAALVLAVTLAFTGCAPAGGCGARALSAAMSQLGKPYIAGAAGPYGYDCSGLVEWSFARAGRMLPRTATAQYYAVAHIPLSALRPGDLIFFGTPAFLYHVAIYAGGGKVVVAPHTGTVVQVERLWTWSFYAGRA
jgi:cell wall-associated NlpC family hydrolase